MATYTPNLNLKKPDGTDYVLVGDLNGNMNVVDATVGRLSELAPSAKTNLVSAINEVFEHSTTPPVLGDNGNWFEWDASLKQYVDTGVKAKGDTGDAAGFAAPIATAVGLGEGDSPIATVIASGPDTAKLFEFNFGIPKGDTGDAAGFGTPVITVDTLPEGSAATAQVTASGPNTAKVFSLNFGIPQGATGEAAGFATPTVVVSTLGPDEPATAFVTATGAATAKQFDFVFGIPKGDTGEAAGFASPTITAQTLPEGSAATAAVSATGENTAKQFDFTLGVPKGDTGDAAGFGTPSISVMPLGEGETPTAVVTATGENTAKVFSFEFGIPKGDTGKGFRILSYFDTLDDLKAAILNPEAGDSYGVGTSEPYSIYIWDGINDQWVDNGEMQGPPGDPGVGIPGGGTAGQVLAKASDADYDAQWVDKKHRFTAVLSAALWEGEGPYTQVAVVSEVTEDMEPITDVELSDDIKTAKVEEEEWNKINDIKTADGAITAVCFSNKPKIDLNIRMKEV